MTVGHDEALGNPIEMQRLMRLYYGALRVAPGEPSKCRSTKISCHIGCCSGHVFPSELIYRWLSYGNGSKGKAGDPTFFKRREFCFTLEGDIFVRYRSYQNATELHQALKNKVPIKIDIGPVYTQDPEKRAAYKGDAAGAFKPLQRELVFDIDLTDYDDVRNSSSGTSMSLQCWSLMSAAIQVLDRSLRDDFGFKHILWVYSGRRGVHCWVCDASARSLTDEQRGAIAAYFAVYKGQEKSIPRMGLHPKMLNHPFVEKAYDILLGHWEKILEDQQLITTERTRKLMLKIMFEGFLSDCESEDAWDKKLTKASSDHEGEAVNSILWDLLTAQAGLGGKNSIKWKKALQYVVFAFCYPRLDIEVSKKTNHLLKAPFCIHPKTAKLCVPIAPETAHLFNPDNVPTLSDLVATLDSRVEKAVGIIKSQHQTIFEQFEKSFLAPLERESIQALVAQAREHDQYTLQW